VTQYAFLSAHCLACQQRTGSVFGAQARFPSEAVTIEGTSTEYVRIGDSGGKIHFHFCPSCGATVYYKLVGAPEVTAISVGAFADPSFPEPTCSVYESRKHSWVSAPTWAEHRS
jgi:hypothetical protein